MKILLISPVRDIEYRTNKGLMMPQLALFIIEGLTPPQHQVKIVEEEYMPIDLEEDCDLSLFMHKAEEKGWTITFRERNFNHDCAIRNYPRYTKG